MKFTYTLHAKDKLQEEEAKLFNITKKKLEAIVKKPNVLQELPIVTRAIGKLDKQHILCVIYRREQDTVKIITFYPAKEGRYEKKKN